MEDLVSPVGRHDVLWFAVCVEVNPLGEPALEPTALNLRVVRLAVTISNACSLGLGPGALPVALNAHCRADTSGQQEHQQEVRTSAHELWPSHHQGVSHSTSLVDAALGHVADTK